MNYIYCTNCGTNLLYVDADCHKCLSTDITLNNLPTLKLNIEEESAKTIKIRIQKIAKNFGISNTYQFQKFTGFSNSMAYHIFKSKWKTINISTLNELCNLFKCTPNDILESTSDAEESFNTK